MLVLEFDPCSINSEPVCDEEENDSRRGHKVANAEWTATERGRQGTVPGDVLEVTHFLQRGLPFTVLPHTLTSSVDWLIR